MRYDMLPDCCQINLYEAEGIIQENEVDNW